MAPLSIFPLPLPSNKPPDGYRWKERELSALSTTTAFNIGIDQRDKFLGLPRCVICGYKTAVVLQHCHIIRESDPELWSDLRSRNWIPSQAKRSLRHEPCNGLLMCSIHHIMFDTYDFFIRYFPEIRKFVFVNFSGNPESQEYHGKAIALDIKDHHAPFPSLFIIQEMRVRGFHPFQPVHPDMPDEIPWQDWVSTDGVFDNALGSFKRTSPPDNGDDRVSLQSPLQFQPTMKASGAPSGGRTLALNEDVMAEILAATRASPSWKACQMEGTSWTGTAEENIQKYVSKIGVESEGCGPS